MKRDRPLSLILSSILGLCFAAYLAIQPGYAGGSITLGFVCLVAIAMSLIGKPYGAARK